MSDAVLKFKRLKDGGEVRIFAWRTVSCVRRVWMCLVVVCWCASFYKSIFNHKWGEERNRGDATCAAKKQ